MKKPFFNAIMIFTVILIAVGGYFLIAHRLNIPPPSASIEGKKNLNVGYTEESISVNPISEVWKSADFTKIHLYPQSARIPYGNSEKELLVKALYNDREIAFLLEFYDETEDRGGPVNPDACAILFVPNDGPATAQMMGYGSKANVWQWLADRDTEKYQKGNESIKTVRELIAHGPGTQTPMENQNVEGRGMHKDGKWAVVFKRDLKSNQEGEFEFKPGTDKNIAFAVWDGIKMESFSRKSISILRTLTLEGK
ncbi:MAG: ethylbenzene dehydrogenase-related protein [Acidobacteriota bacterium]